MNIVLFTEAKVLKCRINLLDKTIKQVNKTVPQDLKQRLDRARELADLLSKGKMNQKIDLGYGAVHIDQAFKLLRAYVDRTCNIAVDRKLIPEGCRVEEQSIEEIAKL